MDAAQRRFTGSIPPQGDPYPDHERHLRDETFDSRDDKHPLTSLGFTPVVPTKQATLHLTDLKPCIYNTRDSDVTGKVARANEGPHYALH
jgi:hypothetical protein